MKATAILLTGDQPPVLFEVAGLPLGLGLLLLTRWSIVQYGTARRLTAAATLASLAVVAATLSAIMELFSIDIVEPLESILAVCSGFGPMIAALLIGLNLRAIGGNAEGIARWALLVAVMFVPLMIAGGIAADLAGERFLELGLLVMAVLWLLLARSTWTTDALGVQGER